MQALSPGASVSFLPEWDDKKKKDRAADVYLGPSFSLRNILSP